MPVVAKVEDFIFKLFHIIMKHTNAIIPASGHFPDFPPTQSPKSLYKDLFPTSQIKAILRSLAAQLEIGPRSLSVQFSIFNLDFSPSVNHHSTKLCSLHLLLLDASEAADVWVFQSKWSKILFLDYQRHLLGSPLAQRIGASPVRLGVPRAASQPFPCQQQQHVSALNHEAQRFPSSAGAYSLFILLEKSQKAPRCLGNSYSTANATEGNIQECCDLSFRNTPTSPKAMPTPNQPSTIQGRSLSLPPSENWPNTKHLSGLIQFRIRAQDVPEKKNVFLESVTVNRSSGGTPGQCSFNLQALSTHLLSSLGLSWLFSREKPSQM